MARTRNKRMTRRNSYRAAELHRVLSGPLALEGTRESARTSGARKTLHCRQCGVGVKYVLATDEVEGRGEAGRSLVLVSLSCGSASRRQRNDDKSEQCNTADLRSEERRVG